MKKIKIWIFITTIFQTTLLFKITACDGFTIEKRNQFYISKRLYRNVPLLKSKRRYNCINRFYLKSEDEINAIETALSNVSEERLSDILGAGQGTSNSTWEVEDDINKNNNNKNNDNKNNISQQREIKTMELTPQTKLLTVSQRNKNEIEQIQKKSESVLLERSFSFNKEHIQIKPELLKELITQKYRKMFQRHEKDCGSSEIQIIILTFKIFFLTEHMKRHKKDFACLRGLFKCVSKRRRLLKYLGTKNRDMFERITDFFKIKKPLLPKTPEYYAKKLKYVYFNNTKRFKNNEEKKKKDKLKRKNVQTDKILFSN